ncbi:hypothetical protein J2857_005336 [Neorhizobium galegae]|uniref:hypothetical protein n=1 Tax=Neorhizobium galegae TaxID=399 RepID=UPI001AE758F8|nr:hypothetical protein [Neorhizobium galegae]MBP2562545.1 hypothetical protein [Neorhizobium galegae]
MTAASTSTAVIITTAQFVPTNLSLFKTPIVGQVANDADDPPIRIKTMKSMMLTLTAAVLAVLSLATAASAEGDYYEGATKGSNPEQRRSLDRMKTNSVGRAEKTARDYGTSKGGFAHEGGRDNNRTIFGR